MDPQVAWHLPEITSAKALCTWSEVWETYLQANNNNNSTDIEPPLRSDREEREDLTVKQPGGKYFKRDTVFNANIYKKHKSDNKASTIGLNHSSNLAILQDSEALMPWLNGNRYHGIEGLNQEIRQFVDYITPTPEEAFMRKKVLDKVIEVIKKQWRDCEIQVFGSFQTGLYLPTSDIDICLIGSWDTPPLDDLERVIKESGVTSETKVIKASVPIVKLVERDTDVRVDISFNQPNGARSAEFIKSCLDYFPSLRYLVIVLKQFLLQRDLNEVFTGGISSYSLILMVISFLQLHPRIDPKQEENLGILLIEFFELYGRHFNYLQTGIRVTDGGAYVPKSDVFPAANAVKTGTLCIQDPLDPNNDIGKSSYGILKVKEAFEYAYLVLVEAVLPHYESLYSNSGSLLGRIIRITPEVGQYRRRIREKYCNLARCSRPPPVIVEDDPYGYSGSSGASARSTTPSTHDSTSVTSDTESESPESRPESTQLQQQTVSKMNRPRSRKLSKPQQSSSDNSQIVGDRTERQSALAKTQMPSDSVISAVGGAATVRLSQSESILAACANQQCQGNPDCQTRANQCNRRTHGNATPKCPNEDDRKTSNCSSSSASDDFDDKENSHNKHQVPTGVSPAVGKCIYGHRSATSSVVPGSSAVTAPIMSPLTGVISGGSQHAQIQKSGKLNRPRKTIPTGGGSAASGQQHPHPNDERGNC